MALKLESANTSKQVLKMEVAVMKKLQGMRYVCYYDLHFHYVLLVGK